MLFYLWLFKNSLSHSLSLSTSLSFSFAQTHIFTHNKPYNLFIPFPINLVFLKSKILQRQNAYIYFKIVSIIVLNLTFKKPSLKGHAS